MKISVEEELRSLRPGFYKDLQYRFQRQKLQPDNIEDVYDGKLYRVHMQPGKFLTNPCNVAFQRNTDGVPLFLSSKYGILNCPMILLQVLGFFTLFPATIQMMYM